MKTQSSQRGKTASAARRSRSRLQRVVLRLREQLEALALRADYVCVHRYEAIDPVGTRVVAINDLRAETRRAFDTLSETENDRTERPPPAVRSSDWLAAVERVRHQEAHKLPKCPICGKADCKEGMINLEGLVPMTAAQILHDLDD